MVIISDAGDRFSTIIKFNDAEKSFIPMRR